MKSKPLIASVVLLVLASIAYLVYFLLNLNNSVGYAPNQPIPFSHKKHAGTYQIPCMYCHVNVDKGRHATVPSSNICMNCHKVVRANPDPSSPDYSPYIQKLKTLYEEGKPVEWVKVHDQPDFVYFNHRPHIAKGVSCESCHGDVKSMDKVTQVKALDMGYCVSCHRQNKAPLTCYTCHH